MGKGFLPSGCGSYPCLSMGGGGPKLGSFYGACPVCHGRVGRVGGSRAVFGKGGWQITTAVPAATNSKPSVTYRLPARPGQ